MFSGGYAHHTATNNINRVPIGTINIIISSAGLKL